ncbi:MAG: Galactoside O-acetyltransferase [Alphaproteobacteria bacterium MarineAlpha3_Bin5]|nr:gamma carbonic anhydrase family protein [Magnetovibrio sp.]PPR80116.1 MAG: Galactoside O-acetyltransferase [Alphaproteobacteria bacterium MarineAlpha3_Bin5]|tara:strand:+ start:504 stop:1028 length:525 start_codon:yes stop_codon:yes gene_type:complete
MKYSLGEKSVRTDGENYWIAPNAIVIGNVTLGHDASVWFGSIIRADNDTVTIGAASQIQDGSILHTDPGYPIIIKNNSSIGHMVLLHGCSIGSNTLIGMGTTILNGATIGNNCLIGARTLITENKEIPDNSVVLGAPGRVIREVTDKDLKLITCPAKHYVKRWKVYKNTLKKQE